MKRSFILLLSLLINYNFVIVASSSQCKTQTCKDLANYIKIHETLTQNTDAKREAAARIAAIEATIKAGQCTSPAYKNELSELHALLGHTFHLLRETTREHCDDISDDTIKSRCEEMLPILQKAFTAYDTFHQRAKK